MPRNSSGVYTLPDGNPVVPGTLIESTWANSTMEDLADALTLSLPRNGSAPMTGPLTLSANPIVGAKQAVTKEYVDAFTAYATGMPIGAIAPFAGVGTSIPGWLLCNGATVSRSTYADLFAAIGTTYGAGDGVLTFGLPDLRNEFIRGVGGSRVVGSHQESSFSAHAHGVTDPTHTHSAIATVGAHAHALSGTTSAGGAFQGTAETGEAGNIGAFTGVDSGALSTSGAVTFGIQGGYVAASNTRLNLNVPDHSHALSGTTSEVAPNAWAQVLGAATGITTQNAGGTETVPQNVAMNYFIKAVNDSSGVPVNTGQRFLGYFNATSGALPQAVYPTFTFVTGDFYEISAPGMLYVFDTNSHTGSTIAVTVGDTITWVTGGTDPEGWYLTEVATASTSAVAVSFAPTGTIGATNVQAAIEEVALEAGKGVNLVSVKDFGAVGDGVHDDTLSIQAAIDSLQNTTGGQVWLPPGSYKITSNLLISWPTVGGKVHKTTLVGSGIEVSYILDYRTGDPTGGAISVDFSMWGAAGVDARYFTLDLGNFSLIKMVNATTVDAGTGVYTLGTGNGLYLNMVVMTGQVRNISIKGYYTSVKAIDTLGATYNGLLPYGCFIGIDSAIGTFAQPNELSINRCVFAACASWGVFTADGSPINITESTFQACGRMGYTSGGVAYSGGSTYAVGMNISRCYFEDNRGAADILLFDPSGANEVATNTIIGCTFMRLSSSFYTTNCIMVYNSSPTSRVTANVIGCGFAQDGTYVPSTSRKYISASGDTTGIRIPAMGNMYESSTEVPTATIEEPGLNTTNSWPLRQTLAALTLGTTPITNPPGGTTTYLRADGTWATPAAGTGVQQLGGMRKTTASSGTTINDTLNIVVANYQANAFTTPVGIAGTLVSGYLTLSVAGNYMFTVNILFTYTADNTANRAFVLELYNVAAGAQIAGTTVSAPQYTAVGSVGFTFPLTITAGQLGQSLAVRVGGSGSSPFANFSVGSCTFSAMSVGPL